MAKHSTAAPPCERPSARSAALALLRGVLEVGRPLDELLESEIALQALEVRDRAFARTITATALRRLGQIDAMIAHCLARPLPTKAALVRNILRLGVVQLVFLGVAAHAGVGETVELAEAAGWGGFKGLINAVLRRLSLEGEGLAAAQDAARLNTPDWLWQSWCRSYGEPTARAIAAAHLAEPQLDLTVKSDPALWAERLDAQVLPTGSLRKSHAGDVRSLPGFAEGAWWVQDTAAALPVRLLGDVAGKRVIDLCAAPGGKTAQLARAGAQVTAVDRSPGRLRRITENLSRLHLTADLIAADAGLWHPARPADAVLLDAPCTATGTIRRHPDVMRLKTPADMARMADEQDRLLRAAVEMVRPGGTIVYSVCSLEAEEGPARIAALTREGSSVVRQPPGPEVFHDFSDMMSAEGDLRTLPCHLGELGGMDGFYACRLVRL
jgi:16S rRNA (cytosine967-C5)-methyltransferase